MTVPSFTETSRPKARLEKSSLFGRSLAASTVLLIPKFNIRTIPPDPTATDLWWIETLLPEMPNLGSLTGGIFGLWSHRFRRSLFCSNEYTEPSALATTARASDKSRAKPKLSPSTPSPGVSWACNSQPPTALSVKTWTVPVFLPAGWKSPNGSPTRTIVLPSHNSSATKSTATAMPNDASDFRASSATSRVSSSHSPLFSFRS
mmetsp:Transcript_17048/g.28393  ORF Transcript_17048/g.28393 Transcript_17048/m.28393 type:complete len:204 (-) Transcript_17048:523-1134(-)